MPAIPNSDPCGWIAEFLHLYRVNRQLSKEQLAGNLKVPVETLTALEEGKAHQFTRELLFRVKNGLNLSDENDMIFYKAALAVPVKPVKKVIGKNAFYQAQSRSHRHQVFAG